MIFIYHGSVQSNELEQKALAGRILKLHAMKWILLESAEPGFKLLETHVGRFLKPSIAANKYKWDGFSFSQE